MQGIGNLVGIKEQAETKAMFDNCFQEQFSVFYNKKTEKHVCQSKTVFYFCFIIIITIRK